MKAKQKGIKIIFFVVALTIAAIALNASCKGDGEEEPILSVSPSVTDIVFSATGTSAATGDGTPLESLTFGVTTNHNSWEVSVTPSNSWLSATKTSAGYGFSLAAAVNNAATPPAPAVVTVTAGNAPQVTINVTQEEMPTLSVSPSVTYIVFSEDGATASSGETTLESLTFGVTTNRSSWDVSVTPSNAWLSAAKTSAGAGFTLAADVSKASTPAEAVEVTVTAENAPKITIYATLEQEDDQKQEQELKILGIGNSFTQDGTEYLPLLLANAGIKNVTLGRMIISGSSFSTHYQTHVQNTAGFTYTKSPAGVNFWNQSVMKTFIEGVSDEDWDIIIFQPWNTDLYGSYQPNLNNLIDIILGISENASLKFGCQMTWAFGSSSTHAIFGNFNNNQMQMYQSIVNTTKTMVETTILEIIIPSSTAIQNLRGTSVNNPPLDLTRDGYHADLGAGRYTLACTWFETLIAPFVKTTIIGNSFRVNDGNVPVTNDNYLLCQKAAQYACDNPFVISIID